MRSPIRLVAVLLLLVVAAFAVTYTSSAQSGDQCGLQYDFDGNGRFTKADLSEWFDLADADGCLYREVAGSDCSGYDYDNSQFVDDDDLAVPHATFVTCYARTANSALDGE